MKLICKSLIFFFSFALHEMVVVMMMMIKILGETLSQKKKNEAHCWMYQMPVKQCNLVLRQSLRHKQNLLLGLVWGEDAWVLTVHSKPPRFETTIRDSRRSHWVKHGGKAQSFTWNSHLRLTHKYKHLLIPSPSSSPSRKRHTDSVTDHGAETEVCSCNQSAPVPQPSLLLINEHGYF